jgi:signal transduction histidine kinase
MSAQGHARLAWSLLTVFVLMIAAAFAFTALSGDSAVEGNDYAAFGWVAVFAPFPIVGALIASRRAGGALGWICMAVGLAIGLTALARTYAMYSLVAEPGALPAGDYFAYMENWSWVVPIGLIGVFLVLLFPDGKLPSPRWRWLVYVASGGMATAIVALSLDPAEGAGAIPVENPIGIERAEGPLTIALLVGVGTLFASIVAALVATVLRFRRAEREQRQQLKWFATAAVLTAAMYFSSVPAGFVSHTLEAVLQSAGVVTWVLLPVAVGVAILRYRLYDIDVVINRSLVYGTLTLFVLGVYAGLVAVADALSSAGGGATSLVAAVVVAVAFAPVKDRLQRRVDRLLYGERRDPYRALSHLGARLEAALTPEDVLPAIVGAVAQALRVPYAAVELREEEGSHVAAALGTPKGGVERVPLHYRGEFVGELAVGLRPGEAAFAPSDRKLLDDLARQAGVAAHAVALTRALQRSRERIVTAREEERRRLRRDLHDGLGPALAGIALQLEAAGNLVERDPAAVDDLLARVRDQAQGVIADIRRLVYDLRPPALDELGLLGALREQAARLDGGLRVTVDGPGRLPELPAAVEVAAYRIGLEALTNVVRHANARACTVRLSANGALELEIADDGGGLASDRRAGVGLGSMRERAEELGGICTIEPGAEGGTRVLARLPLVVR